MKLRVLAIVVLAALPGTGAAGAQPRIAEVAASLHVLIRFDDGTVVAMGENRNGQLGRPVDIRQFFPVQRVDLPLKALQVDASSETSYALLEDGTVWAWGRGYEGQLGMPITGTARATPMAVPGLSRVRRIHAANNECFAVLEDGTVRVWGDVYRPLRPRGYDKQFVMPPAAFTGLDHVTAVSGASSGGVATTDDGHLVVWGRDDLGLLGLGVAHDDPVPATPHPLADVVSVVTGAGAMAAVLKDGRVLTWGFNVHGNLGNGLVANTNEKGQPTPAPVKGITDAVEVKAGTYGRHVIVKRRNRTLIGWGNSDWGQLGAGVVGEFQPTPKPIVLPDVDDYWLGGNFSFARTADGALWFWGEESAMQYFTGLKRNQRVPVKVPPEKYLPPAQP